MDQIIRSCDSNTHLTTKTLLHLALVLANTLPQVARPFRIMPLVRDQFDEVDMIILSKRPQVLSDGFELNIVDISIPGEDRQNIDPLLFEFSKSGQK
jgi:hypothetical protein